LTANLSPRSIPAQSLIRARDALPLICRSARRTRRAPWRATTRSGTQGKLPTALGSADAAEASATPTGEVLTRAAIRASVPWATRFAVDDVMYPSARGNELPAVVPKTGREAISRAARTRSKSRTGKQLGNFKPWRNRRRRLNEIAGWCWMFALHRGPGTAMAGVRIKPFGMTRNADTFRLRALQSRETTRAASSAHLWSSGELHCARCIHHTHEPPRSSADSRTPHLVVIPPALP